MSCERCLTLNAATALYAEYAASYCSVDLIRTLAGASSGIASSIVTCPLDVVKTKLQAQGGFRRTSVSTHKSFSNRGLLGVSRAVWLEKGLRGMYQGLGPTILGYLPRWAIFFSVYHRNFEVFHARFGLQSQWMISLVSSLTAGTCSIVATNPVQVIKTRLMSQTSVSSQTYARPTWHYKSTFDAARQIYRNEGISTFYSGLTPALIGITHLAIQFPLYEKLKRAFTGAGLGEQNEKSRHHISGVLIAGSLSKIVSSSLTYPHEVIRTRLQTQQGLKSLVLSSQRYEGIMRTFRVIWMEEGWRVFYAGLGTSMIRAVPASMTTMLVYENMLSLLTRLKAAGEQRIYL